MENRQQQILSEIKEMMSSIRKQLEQLDAKMAEFQYEVDPQSLTVEPIDVGFDDMPIVQIAPEPVEVSDDLPFFEEAPVVMVEEDDVAEEKLQEEIPAAGQNAVIDVMTTKQQWRKDMPGAAVRDVRSAISLNDRVLFINHLFDEDPMAFQETLTAINQMSSLDEVVEHLTASHPSWDMDSEIVYRFMMAVRRKLN